MSDAITITMDEMYSYIEDEVVKAVQKVGINVDKEKLLDALRASDFVDELINHLFLFYCSDKQEYILAGEILDLLVKYEFVEFTDDRYYRRKKHGISKSSK